MSMLKEFREFAMRSNVVDLAVGVIIGAAFGKIVSSLVADIIILRWGYCWAALISNISNWCYVTHKVIYPCRGAALRSFPAKYF